MVLSTLVQGCWVCQEGEVMDGQTVEVDDSLGCPHQCNFQGLGINLAAGYGQIRFQEANNMLKKIKIKKTNL